MGRAEAAGLHKLCTSKAHPTAAGVQLIGSHIICPGPLALCERESETKIERMRDKEREYKCMSKCERKKERGADRKLL